MNEKEALEIIRDRVRQKGSGSDAELEQALSSLETDILVAKAQRLVAAGALRANKDDGIFEAGCDIANRDAMDRQVPCTTPPHDRPGAAS
jgi:hypothetical protein